VSSPVESSRNPDDPEDDRAADTQCGEGGRLESADVDGVGQRRMSMETRENARGRKLPLPRT